MDFDGEWKGLARCIEDREKSTNTTRWNTVRQ
jgi:hypothetical protein